MHCHLWCLVFVVVHARQQLHVVLGSELPVTPSALYVLLLYKVSVCHDVESGRAKVQPIRLRLEV